VRLWRWDSFLTRPHLIVATAREVRDGVDSRTMILFVFAKMVLILEVAMMVSGWGSFYFYFIIFFIIFFFCFSFLTVLLDLPFDMRRLVSVSHKIQ